jgi:hypothetical protein
MMVSRIELLKEVVRKRTKVITIIVVVVVVVSVIGIATTSSFFDEENDLVAVAEASTNLVRVGESIHFDSSASEGVIESVLWNFSDGNISEERDPIHSYEDPGWYEVTLTVFNPDGGMDEAAIIVGSQCLDGAESATRGRYIDVMPNTWGGPGWSIIIGPNTANPTTSVSVELDRPVGNFWFRVAYYIDRGTENEEYHIVHSENVTLSSMSHTFQHIVQPGDLKDGVSTCDESHLYASVIIWDGKCNGFVFNIATTFPMEGSGVG